MITPINFPEQLPCFLREDFAIQQTNDIQRSQFVSGRARHRREFENTPTSVVVSIYLTDIDAQAFELWYKYDVRAINWFNAKVRSPLGYRYEVMRFKEKYSGPSLVGNKWKYTLSLELYEQPAVNGDWYQYAKDYILMSDIFDIAMNEEWPSA